MTTAEKEIKRDKIFKMGKGKSCTYTLEMAFDCFNHSLRFSHWTQGKGVNSKKHRENTMSLKEYDK